MIYTADGNVYMDPDREEKARAILKEIDPLLDLVWMDVVKRYALTCRWADSDKRWEAYRSQEIGECFDIIGWFVEPDDQGRIGNGERLPLDPLSMMDVVARYLGQMDNSRQPWRDRMQKSVEHNAKVTRERRQAIIDETVETTEYYRKKFHSEPIVGLGDGTRGSIHVPPGR